MNKLIIAGVAASVALIAFVVFMKVGPASSHKGLQQASLSSGSLHLAISAPIKKPSGPIILPPPTL